MISLPIIYIVLWVAYTILILFKFGVPVSYSETSYLFSSKWDWLFGAWCASSALFGFYWFTVAPPELKWISVVTIMAILMIGVSSFYKSDHEKIPTVQTGNIIKMAEDSGEVRVYTQKPDNGKTKKSFKEWLKEILAKFNPKEFLKYGWVRPIHYINSLIAIVMINIYTILTVPNYAATFAVLMNIVFILIGTRVDGAYNPKFSVDIDNKSWIFFLEVIAFMQMFIFIW